MDKLKGLWIKFKSDRYLVTTTIIFGSAGIIIVALVIWLIISVNALLEEQAVAGNEIVQATSSVTTALAEESSTDRETGTTETTEAKTVREWLDNLEITEKFLRPNEYSRPQTPLEEVAGVVIHYVANPGTSALQNRNYFDGLADSKLASSSSHYVVGLEGEIIQCIPLNEISYATRQANYYTVSIECCHPDATGKFNEETYRSVVKLAAYVCNLYGLEREDIIRHYDVTGKECPLYYVQHEDAWEQMKDDIIAYLETGTEP